MEGFVAGIALAGDHAWAVSKQAPGLDEASIFDYKNLMGPCSLNLIFLIAHERIRFGGAVDRAAVDRAVDLAGKLKENKRKLKEHKGKIKKNEGT